MLTKKLQLKKRHNRVRGKISGSARVPRLCVFRSNQHIYAQIIDDNKGKTLLSAKDSEVKTKEKGKVALSLAVGQLIAEKAIEKKIKEVVFDRAGNKYHGRIKAVAEGARIGGLKF